MSYPEKTPTQLFLDVKAESVAVSRLRPGRKPLPVKTVLSEADRERIRLRRRALQLAWCHRTKHKRGIKDRVRKTQFEKDERRRQRERETYLKHRQSLGLVVHPRSSVPFTAEEKHARMLVASRKWRATHREQRLASAKAWAARNRHKGMKRFVERYNTDPRFNIAIKCRRRIYMAIRAAFSGKGKRDKNIHLLGCSYHRLQQHIESLLVSGMTWDLVMQGQIHLDHKQPLASFDLTDPAQQRLAFHFSNLQPLWAGDNRRKGARL